MWYLFRRLGTVWAAALLLLTVLLGLPAAASAAGRIVVNHDEWTLANSGGFHYLPADTRQFVLNLAGWFAEGRPGRFLIYSNNFGLAGTGLQGTLRTAGHTVTVTTALPFTLGNLAPYDAVFVGGYRVDPGVLTDYVQAGGGVYLAAGTGSLAAEHAVWNPFLNAFGLGLTSPYNGVQGSLVVTPGHPILAGIGRLYYNNGNTVVLTAPANPGAQIVTTYGGRGLIGVFEEQDCDAALTWNAPLDGAPYELHNGDILPVRFRWGTCSRFIRDESVAIVVRDWAYPEYPVTAYMYGWDIMIDDGAEEYRVDFDSAWYGLSPGTVLDVEVYMGDQLVGTARVDVVP